MNAQLKQIIQNYFDDIDDYYDALDEFIKDVNEILKKKGDNEGIMSKKILNEAIAEFQNIIDNGT